MPDTTDTRKDLDTSFSELCKTLLNAFVKKSQDMHGDTALTKLQNAVKYEGNEAMWDGITAISTYLSARSQERQAQALESIASTVASQQRADAASTDAQAIIDQRESKRDYLATTYSLPTPMLMFLWAIRGMLVDASLKSLSRPNSFEPYQRLTTAELAWSLRLTSDQFIEALPRRGDDDHSIDYRLLEEFDIMHYGGTDDEPEDWMFGG